MYLFYVSKVSEGYLKIHTNNTKITVSTWLETASNGPHNNSFSIIYPSEFSLITILTNISFLFLAHSSVARVSAQERYEPLSSLECMTYI